MLFTLMSQTKDEAFLPATRDVFVCCVRTMAISQKKVSFCQPGSGHTASHHLALVTPPHTTSLWSHRLTPPRLVHTASHHLTLFTPHHITSLCSHCITPPHQHCVTPPHFVHTVSHHLTLFTLHHTTALCSHGITPPHQHCVTPPHFVHTVSHHLTDPTSLASHGSASLNI